MKLWNYTECCCLADSFWALLQDHADPVSVYANT